MHNVNNKPASDRRKDENRNRAMKFAHEAKTVLRRPKSLILLDLIQNYGLKIRDARGIYKAV